jgi:hypothetical protein
MDLHAGAKFLKRLLDTIGDFLQTITTVQRSEQKRFTPQVHVQPTCSLLLFSNAAVATSIAFSCISASMCEVFTTGLTSARLDIAVKLGVAAKRIGVPLAAGVADSSFAMWNQSGN